MIAAAGVFASSTRWPDLVVAALIAGLNLSAALRVMRLARGELQLARDECELHPGVPTQTGLS